MTPDLHDTRIALREALLVLESLVSWSGRHPDSQDIERAFSRIRLARVLVSDDNETTEA